MRGIGKGIAPAVCVKRVRTSRFVGGREDVLANAAEELRLTKLRVKSLPSPADVTTPGGHWKILSGQTASHFGKIDILINNAGRSAGGDFETMSDAAWYEDLDLKLMGAIRCARLVIPHMKNNGSGRIINITHPGGKQPSAGSCPTSVSRCGRDRADESTL